MKKCILSLDDLNMLCTFWQQKLRITQWEVEITFAHHLSMNGSAAQITFDEREQSATISIPTPETYTHLTIKLQHMHRSLIHELLHLAFLDSLVQEDAKHGIQGEQTMTTLDGLLEELYHHYPDRPIKHFT